MAAVLAALLAPAGATEWQAKPVRIVVPYGPGGAADEEFFEAADEESYAVLPGRADAGVILLCDHAGNAFPPGYGTLQQGFLETSNVNAVQEVTDLITAQRAYEMNSKIISAADEMLQITSKMS